MQLGVVFPQTKIGADRGAIRAYATTVEQLGYRHILAYDHVLGADRTVHQGFAGPYDIGTTFHEPLVLYGYLAAITSLELVTGVVILPQRQTALVAKQAAEVDLLTGGRFRLGVGLGWNSVEYAALGKRFTDRGRRIAEQVELLRLLWTQPSVTFEGRYESVIGAGLAPMPVQRPVPIWFGANTPAALQRAGRLADGWFPQREPGPELEADIEQVRAAAEAAGRKPALGMEGRVRLSGDTGAAAELVDAWRGLGATHVSVDTMRLGYDIDKHLAALSDLARAVGPMAAGR
ncbi:MAG: LLM class F420-dependent oxidoreductase [Micromonosporaceae bacterium]|nr:LLM class F420-dependent oxidoreductase [Micromonosporaceae bacterium]